MSRHIVMASPFYPPDISGAGRYLADIAAASTARGDAVTIMHLGGQTNGLQQTGETVQSVRGRRRGMTSLVAMRQAVSLHARQPIDLLVAGLAHPTGVMLAAVARLTGVPLVTVVASEELAAATSSRIARRSLRVAFAASRHAIAVSSWTADSVAGFSPVSCTVIPPSLDAAPYLAGSTSEARARSRAALGLDDRRVVLTVGRLEPRKGHDTVLRALAALGPDHDDVHYVIVGQGDQTPLRQLAASLQFADRLTILSDLSHRELIATYAAADVFAMLSRPGPIGEIEGFGIVYLEAAACGVPCVAGNLGGCADAVADGVTGLLVDPRKPIAVTAALAALLDDPERARVLGARGRERVVRYFDRASQQATAMDVIDGAVQ